MKRHYSLKQRVLTLLRLLPLLTALVAYGGVTPASQLLFALIQMVRAMSSLSTKFFIERNGLQYTTKTNFVNILGDTIRNTIDGYMTTNAVTANIKAEQQENIAYGESANSV